jgi:hypothetical protein
MAEFTDEELAQLRHLCLRLVCSMNQPLQNNQE